MWKIVYDASITPERKGYSYASDDYKVELVSPIMKYEDMDTVQEVVRAIRKAGGKVNSSCGIHIHIGKGDHTAKSLINLAKMVASKQDLMYQALGTSESRANRWCKKVDSETLARLAKAKTETALRKAWYNGLDGAHTKYHQSRYAGLNFHSLWRQGTIEFRCFEATLHAGMVKTIIQLCLAMSHKALTQSKASSKVTATTNPAYSMRVWLLGLGFIGEEFKTARHHLLKNLEGNKAWRDGEARAAA